MKQLLVLNGPNMNLLGQREPEKYGRASLKDLEASLAQSAAALKCSVQCRQSNSESELIGWLQTAPSEGFVGIVFNPAAYSHTSLALQDAVVACPLPVVEVHLTNIHAREAIRQTSLIAPAANGTITGLGAVGYLLAMQALVAGSGSSTSSASAAGTTTATAEHKQ